jgi:hypothetical protein
MQGKIFNASPTFAHQFELVDLNVYYDDGTDEEYKKIIIIKLNKHLVIRMFVSRGVCMCIHPPTHTHTHTQTHR